MHLTRCASIPPASGINVLVTDLFPILVDLCTMILNSGRIACRISSKRRLLLFDVVA